MLMKCVSFLMKQTWFSSRVLILTTLASALGSESPLPSLTGNPIPRSPDVFIIISEPKSGPSSNTAAVDARGKRHQSSEYRGTIVPWFVDTVHARVPYYPYFDRRHRQEGHGLF